MPEKGSKGGTIAIVIFGLIWTGMAFTMGMLMLDFAATWPTDFGPSPYLFAWIPFAFAAAGIICIVGSIWGYVKEDDISGPEDVQITSVADPSFDEFGSHRSSGYRPVPTIDIPDTCGRCGAELSYEDINWVGPLAFECPHCGHHMRAQRRGI